MKCLECGKEIEDMRHTCPHCGGGAFGASGNDALSMLDAMGDKAKAKGLVDRGAQLTMQGRYAEAEAVLKNAIEINPYNATAHGNMGGVFFHQTRYKEAIPWLEKALALNPSLEGVPQALEDAKRQSAAIGQNKGSGCTILLALLASSVIGSIAVFVMLVK